MRIVVVTPGNVVLCFPFPRCRQTQYSLDLDQVELTLLTFNLCKPKQMKEMIEI